MFGSRCWMKHTHHQRKNTRLPIRQGHCPFAGDREPTQGQQSGKREKALAAKMQLSVTDSTKMASILARLQKCNCKRRVPLGVLHTCQKKIKRTRSPRSQFTSPHRPRTWEDRGKSTNSLEISTENIFRGTIAHNSAHEYDGPKSKRATDKRW